MTTTDDLRDALVEGLHLTRRHPSQGSRIACGCMMEADDLITQARHEARAGLVERLRLMFVAHDASCALVRYPGWGGPDPQPPDPCTCGKEQVEVIIAARDTADATPAHVHRWSYYDGNETEGTESICDCGAVLDDETGKATPKYPAPVSASALLCIWEGRFLDHPGRYICDLPQDAFAHAHSATCPSEHAPSWECHTYQPAAADTTPEAS